MASKKDKFLESAQRFMLKGQLDKAIKDYQQVVALEPKEIRYRQKLAELLVRDSRKEEAIAQYEGIAKHYADNSYYLKAIAVYKQIQRLSPNNTEVLLTIASLNHKQGLVGNALAEYGQVVAQYEKEGNLKEAVKALEQMLVIDGEHAATRLKHAELLFAAGSEDAAYEAFSSLLRSLKGRGDAAAAQQVAARMNELFASRQTVDLDAVSARVALGEYDGAIEVLKERVKQEPHDLRAWQLLCDAKRGKGDLAELRRVYSQMMNLFPDEVGVIEAGIRFHIDSGDSRGALSLIELHLPRFTEKGATATVESLLSSLSAGVAKDPRVADALNRLYGTSGAKDKLAALSGQGAGPAQFGPAASLFSAQPAAAEPPSAFEPPADDDLHIPGELPAPWEMEAPASAAAEPSLEAAAWEEEIELDLDDDDAVAAPAKADLPLDISLSLDLNEIDLQEEAAVPAEADAPFAELPDFDEAPAEAPCAFSEPASFDEAPPAAGEPAPWQEPPSAFGEPSADEEPPSAFGEFSFDEPPPFAGVTTPFDEEPAPISEAPSPAAEPVAEAAPADGLNASYPSGEGDGEAPETALDLALPEEGDEFPDIEWSEDGELLPEAAAADEARLPDPLSLTEEAAAAALSEEVDDVVEEVEEREEIEEGELFDELELAEAFPEQFSQVPLPRRATPAGPVAPSASLEDAAADVEPAKPGRSWQEIFPQAVTGTEVSFDLEELESHYDLGVGYKEMGMYSQAIKEFAVAATNPQRRLDCLTLQAVCYREKGEPAKAQELLEKGREIDVLSDGERMTISYELAYLFETTGSPDQAITLYREVHQADPGFHDVAQRLSALTGEEPLDIIDLDLEDAEL